MSRNGKEPGKRAGGVNRRGRVTDDRYEDDLTLIYLVIFCTYTRGHIFTHTNLAIVYYINTLDIQLCRRGRSVPTILYVEPFKTINSN